MLATNLLGAQASKPQSSESGTISPGGADATILKLLQQSHDLDQQLPVWDRATLLADKLKWFRDCAPTWVETGLMNCLGYRLK